MTRDRVVLARGGHIPPGRASWQDEHAHGQNAKILAVLAAERRRLALKRARSRRPLQYTPCSRSPLPRLSPH